MSARSAAVRRGLPAAGVAAPDDKRFRRPDVRPSGRRRLRWLFGRAARMAALAVAGAAVAYFAIGGLLSSGLFSIEHVFVRGNSRLSTGEVEALMQGIQGQHILRVNLDEYRRRLMDSPWVGAASLRRVLPGTLEVQIHERAPMAVARVGDRLYLVDSDGVIVDDFGPQYRDLDLPIVDGLVQTPPGAPPVIDAARASLAHRFLEELQASDTLRQRVSQIDVSSDRDVIVLLDQDPTVVHLGDAKFVQRLTTYEELGPTLQDRLRDVDYVDMRFDERVYVKSKGQHLTVAKQVEN